MAKVADPYLKVDPWAITEEGFDPERNRTSESIFSLGNEYMGVRGYADEGYSGDSLPGSYFNGLNEQMEVGNHYKGIIRSLRYMVNAVDWLHTRISVDGEPLDLAHSRIEKYTRRLDFRTGTYTREFIWLLADGKKLKLRFTRLVSMTTSHLGMQEISFTALNFTGKVDICTGLDFGMVHEEHGQSMWKEQRSGEEGAVTAIMASTLTTGNQLFSGFVLKSSQALHTELVEDDRYIGRQFSLMLAEGEPASFTKLVVNVTDSDASRAADRLWTKAWSWQQRLTGWRRKRCLLTRPPTGAASGQPAISGLRATRRISRASVFVFSSCIRLITGTIPGTTSVPKG
ncbi:hypothetical protein [Paenibacillus rhizoplanae]|uniref:hypothetical protein n=1 Tax=Paenibacillus rhizoplanae TaxID=1917181 RepID=UPI003617E45C